MPDLREIKEELVRQDLQVLQVKMGLLLWENQGQLVQQGPQDRLVLLETTVLPVYPVPQDPLGAPETPERPVLQDCQEQPD